MAKSKTPVKEIPSTTPLLNRRQIQEKLEKVMAELKPALGEKKFKRRMKKAGKLISSGLEKKQLKEDINPDASKKVSSKAQEI